MNTKFYSAVVILLVVFTLAACGSAGDGQANLNGTSWVLSAYRNTKPIETAKPTLNFEGDQVSGNASCNSYGGSYQVNGDKITFGTMFMTEMFCMDPEGVMDQESLYLQMLGSAERFELSDGQLVLFLTGGETLTFVPAE